MHSRETLNKRKLVKTIITGKVAEVNRTKQVRVSAKSRRILAKLRNPTTEDFTEATTTMQCTMGVFRTQKGGMPIRAHGCVFCIFPSAHTAFPLVEQRSEPQAQPTNEKYKDDNSYKGPS